MKHNRWLQGIMAVAIALALIVGVATCHSQSYPAAGGSVTLNRSFEISLNETVVVEPGHFEITLVNVDDSRCPSDVQCPWAGQVTTTVEVAQAGRSLGSFHLVHQPTPEGTAGQTIDGHTLQVLNVSPYPTSSSPIEPSAYRVQLRLADP